MLNVDEGMGMRTVFFCYILINPKNLELVIYIFEKCDIINLYAIKAMSVLWCGWTDREAKKDNMENSWTRIGDGISDMPDRTQWSDKKKEQVIQLCRWRITGLDDCIEVHYGTVCD